jgi:hypothetical protein
MAVENPTFRSDLARETRLPLLGEPVLTPGTLDQLKIPDEVALRPENVIPFLAKQSVRYHEIVDRPEIKTMSAEIPEYVYDDSAQAMQPRVTTEEQVALDSWYGEKKETLMKTQSLDDLDQDIQNHIDEMRRLHPEYFQDNSPDAADNGGDLISQMLTGDMLEETDEQKKKWLEILSMAKSPDMVNLLMTFRGAKQASAVIGKLAEQYKSKIDAMDKLSAEYALKNQGGAISTADAQQFNIDSMRTYTDITETFQVMTRAVSDLEKVEVGGSKTATDINKTLQGIIQNFK